METLDVILFSLSVGFWIGVLFGRFTRRSEARLEYDRGYHAAMDAFFRDALVRYLRGLAASRGAKAGDRGGA